MLLEEKDGCKEMMIIEELPHDKIAEVDEGVRELVQWLRRHGFETTDSGDGSKVGKMACALDVPMVVVRVEPSELWEKADLLFDLMQDLGVEIVPGAEKGAHLEGSYDPADGIAVLVLTGIDDEAAFGLDD